LSRKGPIFSVHFRWCTLGSCTHISVHFRWCTLGCTTSPFQPLHPYHFPTFDLLSCLEDGGRIFTRSVRNGQTTLCQSLVILFPYPYHFLHASHSCTLKMRAASSSETSVTIYKTASRRTIALYVLHTQFFHHASFLFYPEDGHRFLLPLGKIYQIKRRQLSKRNYCLPSLTYSSALKAK
jgi:hypothetical protein